MSSILKVFRDHTAIGEQPAQGKHKPSWWIMLDCGHWYHWTGNSAPKNEGEFPCPSCQLPVAVVEK